MASGGELATVARAGIGADRVIMTGPGKRDDELRAAVVAGIRAITVELPGELARLEAIAADAGRVQPVMLRASVSERSRLERVRLVGDDGAGKFGMDAPDLVASASPRGRIAASRAAGPARVRRVERARCRRRSSSMSGRPSQAARRLALGGRDRAPAHRRRWRPRHPLRTARGVARPRRASGAGLAEITRDWAADPLLRDARLLLEPGRFLVGPAGAYLARVVDRKTVDGSIVVILDGGVHHVLRPALVGQEHRIRGFSARPEGAAGANGRLLPVTVAGPLCSGLDVFSQGAVMSPPEVGDLVAVLDVGAYGFTESMPLFLSHPIPAEVAVRDGRRGADPAAAGPRGVARPPDPDGTLTPGGESGSPARAMRTGLPGSDGAATTCRTRPSERRRCRRPRTS